LSDFLASQATAYEQSNYDYACFANYTINYPNNGTDCKLICYFVSIMSTTTTLLSGFLCFVAVLVSAQQTPICIPASFTAALDISTVLTDSDGTQKFIPEFVTYYYDVPNQSLRLDIITLQNVSLTILERYDTGIEYSIMANSCVAGKIPVTDNFTNCFTPAGGGSESLLVGGSLEGSLYSFTANDNVAVKILLAVGTYVPIASDAAGAVENSNTTFITFTQFYNVNIGPISADIFTPPSDCSGPSSDSKGYVPFANSVLPTIKNKRI